MKKIEPLIAMTGLVESTATACLIALPTVHVHGSEQRGIAERYPPLVLGRVGRSGPYPAVGKRL